MLALPYPKILQRLTLCDGRYHDITKSAIPTRAAQRDVQKVDGSLASGANPVATFVQVCATFHTSHCWNSIGGICGWRECVVGVEGFFSFVHEEMWKIVVAEGGCMGGLCVHRSWLGVEDELVIYIIYIEVFSSVMSIESFFSVQRLLLNYYV